MKINFVLLLVVILAASCSEEQPDFPQVGIADLEISEGNTSKIIDISILLSKPINRKVTVVVSTQDGTAEAGTDYVGLDNIEVEFEPNDVAEAFELTILGDEDFELSEYLSIQLVSAENAVIEQSTSEVLLINDDEGEYSLIWSDEFDEFDPEKWTYEIGGSGWGNNELQYYTDRNTSITNGRLIIEARQESEGGRSYTSSRIITKDKFEFTYGRVDIRAVLPYGQGIWPALWMLGANISEVGWPSCGEIDIMEMIGGQGREDTTHGTIHFSNTAGDRVFLGGEYSLPSGTFSDDFHVFSMIWDENSIQWLVDDEVFHQRTITAADQTEFHEDFFFIFNIAVGGNWPGNPDGTTVFPQQMIVDYIRVFQEN